MATIHLNKAGFLRRVADIDNKEWKFLGERPALIDFYAPWCGPCKMLSPVLEELSEEFEGKVDIYKVNVDEEEELSAAFGIRSVPTLIFVPMNGAPQMSAGALPKPQLKEAIERILLYFFRDHALDSLGKYIQHTLSYKVLAYHKSDFAMWFRTYKGAYVEFLGLG